MVAVEDNQPRSTSGSAGAQPPHRPCRAAVLDHGDDAVRFDPLGEIDGFGSDDEDEGIWTRILAGAQHAGDHWNTGDGVQWFWDQRTHAGARAGGKHDETNLFVLLRW